MISIMETRIPLVVGNWKMHGSKPMLEQFIQELKDNLAIGITSTNTSTTKTAITAILEIAICPPFVYLEQTRRLLRNSAIKLGAQNCYFETAGAFTGEVSPSMLSDIGCDYVILGHSERRQLFAETDAIIAKKCQSAYDAGLIPILCVGETADERKEGKTFDIVTKQLDAVLASGTIKKLVLAYEPVWAIGTGVTASPAQAEEVHRFLREKLSQYGTPNTRILYGGSVKPGNAKALFEQPNIDGGLIGGASLIARDFFDICSKVGDGSRQETL